MRKTPPEERFIKLGFWYECPDLVGDPRQIKMVPKQLEWRFVFDTNKIKVNKKQRVELAYGISVPNMFPIINGRFNPAEVPWDNYKFSSSLEVKHKINNLVYVLSLCKGIEIEENPTFRRFKPGGRIEGEKIGARMTRTENHLFYRRYMVFLTSPKIGTTIKTTWGVARQKGGNDE